MSEVINHQVSANLTDKQREHRLSWAMTGIELVIDGQYGEVSGEARAELSKCLKYLGEAVGEHGHEASSIND